MGELAVGGLVADVASDDEVVKDKIIGAVTRSIASGEDHDARVGVLSGVNILDSGGVSGGAAVGEDDVATE